MNDHLTGISAGCQSRRVHAHVHRGAGDSRTGCGPRGRHWCQPGETTSFSASDHITAIRRQSGGQILDCAVVSISRIPPAVRRNYAAQNAAPVENDCAAIESLGLEVLEADLLQKGSRVRHNPEAIARVAMDLAVTGRKRRLAKLG